MARGFIVIIGVITAFARASQISIDHASRLAVSSRRRPTFAINFKCEGLIQCGVKCEAFARNREDKSRLCYRLRGWKLCTCLIYKGHQKKHKGGRSTVYWCSADSFQCYNMAKRQMCGKRGVLRKCRTACTLYGYT